MQVEVLNGNNYFEIRKYKKKDSFERETYRVGLFLIEE